MQTKSRSWLVVKHLLVVQLIVATGLPLFSLIFGKVVAYSTLIGTLIFLVPNYYFVLQTFKYSGARSANKIVRSFYMGESVKLLLIALFFGLAFAFIEPIEVLAVFAGFIALQLTSWLTPWLAVKG